MDSKTLGIASLVSAMLAFTAQDVLMKWLSGDYPLHEIVFFRASLAAMLTLVVMRFEGGLWLLRTHRLGTHLLRGGLIVIANSCYFLALADMTLAEASALFFVAPLIITALSAGLLREYVGPRRWAAVCIGLSGVIVMLRPGDGIVRLIALLPLLSAISYACMQITTRHLGATEKASTMAFYIQITMLVVSACVGLIAGDGRYAPDDNPSLEFLLRAWTVPGPVDALLFAATGTLNAIGGYCVSQAYRLTAAPVVAPFEYVALPLAVMWGFVVFGDLPDSTTILGIALIAGSGLYVLHRETLHLRRRRAEIS